MVVQRTGWGKSSVYFIATRILRDRGAGPSLIVSPLLALMRNQIDAAERLGLRGATISTANREEWAGVTREIVEGTADLLLVAPERLANQSFLDDVLTPIANGVGLVVVDEAHCISDWGHDFRPDYQRIVNVLRPMPPNMPVLGTTAPANDRVVDDIQGQLGNIEVQRAPLVRESLSLQTLRLPDAAARLAWLAQHVPELPGTGIIYVLTKRDAELVARWLELNGIDARPYYSDVQHPDFESELVARGLNGKTVLHPSRLRVMTSAAGTARAAIRRYDDRLGADLFHRLDYPMCVENVLELLRVMIADYFAVDFKPMLQTPPLVIDAEEDRYRVVANSPPQGSAAPPELRKIAYTSGLWPGLVRCEPPAILRVDGFSEMRTLTVPR